MPDDSNSKRVLFERRILPGLLVALCTLMFSFQSLVRADVFAVPYVAKTAFVCLTTFFANAYWLLPHYLFRGRSVPYALGLLATVAAMLALLILLAPWRDHDMPAPPPGTFPLHYHWLLPIFGSLFVSTIYGYYLKERNSRRREMDLTHQSIELEMKFLKSQINPHFLFNALNNIYALSIVKSERTPDMILKLSDMLRFTLYDSENPRVKLRRELEYMTNYIEFQKLKTDTELNIQLDTGGVNDEFMLEPMLLIPFIENSFKHGNIENAKKGYLHVEVRTMGPTLIFSARNSMPSIAKNKDQVGGIGVENVRRRLNMLYPGRYEMRVSSSPSEYAVYLQIDTGAGRPLNTQ